MPSRSSIGKKSRAWLRVSQRAKPSRWAACFWVHTRAPTPTSGSLSTWFGLAWWRTCLSFHQASFIPRSRLACTRPMTRLALRSPDIWACPASCPKKAVRVHRTASGRARKRFHQVSPRITMPVITAPSTTRLAAMPAAYQPVRRSRSSCPLTVFRRGAKSLPGSRRDRRPLRSVEGVLRNGGCCLGHDVSGFWASALTSSNVRRAGLRQPWRHHPGRAGGIPRVRWWCGLYPRLQKAEMSEVDHWAFLPERAVGGVPSANPRLTSQI